ncbi:DNA-binding response regulator [Cellvibrio zantedeschiae]|uniref:DNA-binding response regulator n=1 Tax=Cellvibrio zantedeschiae TaxID=1237077 RepID=A0ABQ3AT15_9GAMM|nr:LytTR family DNA-binding domain-containing protein [Cellvibrio zantedeschiae]GGY66364.1 DNA-binding response regulator [Cellvibrio zantedeschiae]
MTLQLLIVDDEPLARRLTREYLAKHSDINIIGECANGEDAVEAILKLEPDLILLDIHMPRLSGLEVLEITGRSNGVIFTTAYDQYALKAFDLHAVDYLLKPFSQERFDEAIARAKTLQGVQHTNIPVLIAETRLERIVVRDRGQVQIIPLADIDYIEAQDDYINICWQGKSVLKTQSLSSLEAQLNSQEFVRIHRSFIVRLSAIKGLERISKDAQVAVLHNGTKLPVSRTGYERIKLHFVN